MRMRITLPPFATNFLRDPRNLQITVLATLALYGALVLDFVLTPLAPVVVIATALALEHLTFRFRKADDRRSPPYKSAMISALSTLLLFRSTDPLAYAAVIAVAVLSKSIFRINGRHFINPTNGAVLACSLIFPGWIASGQWGHDTVLIFALAGAGSLILTRAGRLDSAVAFLAGSVACQLLRHYVLGFRWTVIGYHFTNGALWLFALYMITDPRTTPEKKWARIFHGIAVAVLGTYLAQYHYVRDSFLWSLLILAPAIPLIDWATRRREPQAQTNPSGGLQIHERASAA